MPHLGRQDHRMGVLHYTTSIAFSLQSQSQNVYKSKFSFKFKFQIRIRNRSATSSLLENSIAYLDAVFSSTLVYKNQETRSSTIEDSKASSAVRTKRRLHTHTGILFPLRYPGSICSLAKLAQCNTLPLTLPMCFFYRKLSMLVTSSNGSSLTTQLEYILSV